MKKKIISVVIAGLIGVAPLSSFAASNSLSIQPGKSVSMIRQNNRQQEYDQRYRKGKNSDHDRGEKDRREDERREKERREQERREDERRERERREEARREHERRERERREAQRREQERNDARYIIHRTADVIFVAQRSTGRRNYYNGMAQAVAHQQKARRLFMNGYYQDAIFHSLRARRIAITVIQGNREKWSGSWDDREERYRRNAPRDNDLDIKLNFIKIGDKEAVRISIDLDIK